MKPVFQVGATCWEACVASILEVELYAVISVDKEKESVGWLVEYREWLKSVYNCIMLDVPLKCIGLLPSGAHCIVSGCRPQDGRAHAIVAYCDGDTLKPVHDPGGDSGFNIGEPDQWVITFIWKLSV